MKKNKIDILLVDDREDGLLALEVVLKDNEYNLVKARSGEEAIKLVQNYNFAVVLLDVQMPGIDGFQTATLLRQIPNCEHLPIIFVTAINKDDSYVVQGYDAGAVDYLFKPFDPHVLKAKVSVFVDLHRKNLQIYEQADLIAQIKERERIHERTRIEVESLRRYQNLADAIPHLLWKTGPTGALIYCNSGWREYTGFDIEMSADTKWREAFEAEDLKNLLKVWLDAMSSGKSFEMECRVRRHDGSLRWHWLKVVSELNEQGEVTSWIGTCTDIHERKVFEQKSVEACKLAESASKAKTYFLANMSHEIRTPLSAILGFSELLLDSNQSLNEKINCVTTIRNNGKQLLKIIDEVLDISKVEAGRLELESTEVETNQFFQDLFVSLSLKAVDKGLTLKFNALTPLPEIIRTDVVRLRQILINIISNAIKFTQKGSVEAFVVWEQSTTHDSKLEILVKDSGIGIDPDSASKLFNPFVQGDSSTTRRFGGTGLGLALSRKLARALGGDVSLEESSAQGSVFKVVITPLSYSKNFRAALFDKTPLETQFFHEPSSRLLDGIKVLLAEDVAENRLLITKFLQLAGANVEATADGLEAVRLAQKGFYDVILMDIQMPNLDGYEATSKLRKENYKRPIIALTAHALHEERKHCLEAGFDDHLTKPIDRTTLIESVAYYSREGAGKLEEPFLTLAR